MSEDGQAPPRTAAKEISDWFFEDYLPTWVGVGADRSQDGTIILRYWGAPLHAASVHMTRCLMTGADVMQLLRANHDVLQAQGYTHTAVPDRKVVGYNANAGSIDVIWSRRRADESEIERIAVHFEIHRTAEGWRVAAIASARTDRLRLDEIWEVL